MNILSNYNFVPKHLTPYAWTGAYKTHPYIEPKRYESLCDVARDMGILRQTLK